MNFMAPSPASTSLHQVSTDSIVVVCSSLVVCLLQPSVPPIAISEVPTFELVCTSCGLTYTSVWGGGCASPKHACTHHGAQLSSPVVFQV